MRITCEGGLPGFEGVTSYELADSEESGPFRWLRASSCEGPGEGPAFIVVDPRLFWPSYSVRLDREDLDSLGLRSIEEADLYVIVTVPDDPLLATANLFAPLVVNARSGQMRQVLLRGTTYALSAYLFPERIREGKVGLASACPDAPRR